MVKHIKFDHVLDTIFCWFWAESVQCAIEGLISLKNTNKKSESLQTEGRHFRSMICKLSDV